MRQGQQNKRMRGRGRKPSSPLNRVFESNGPDVKIRGPASHIAEKYLSLARDAQSSGDPISAENYLQHAEHYFRIISSAQTPSQQPSPPQPNQPQPVVDQPAGELNGAAQGSRRDGEEPRAEASGDQRKQAGAEDRKQDGKQDGAEDAPQKPRRRRSPEARARAGNGHDTSSKDAATDGASGDDDSPATDAEPGVEKPAESAA